MKQNCRAIRLIFLAFGLAISAWAPLVPLVKSNLQLDDAELGLVLFVLGFGALITMPLTGWLINQVGSRSITFISGLGVLTVLPLLTLAPSTLTLCIFLFLFGVVTGAMNVSMNAQSVDIEIACKTPILSGVHCWFSIGGLLGASIVSGLIALQLPLYCCTLAISGIILLILCTQCNRLLEFDPTTKNINEVNAGSFTMTNPQVLILGALCFIAFMAEGSMLDWSAEYLRSNLNYDTSTAGIGFALFSVAMAFGRFIGDRAIRKFGPIEVFQWGCLIAASGFLIVVNASWGYFELLGFCLIGVGASNSVPILFGCSGKLSNISSNNALTIITTCGYIGLLFGPAVLGLIAQATTLSFALAIIAVFLIGIGMCARAALPATSTS